jgi:hypothetical protein
LLSGELAAGGWDDVRTGVGVPLESPTALGRLRDQHPGALGQLRLARGSDDVGQLPDHAELLIAIENADRREDLHSPVVDVAGNIRQRVCRLVAEERRGVFAEQREVRDLLP